MTNVLIPGKEEMTAKVARIPTATVLVAFCKFISATQTTEEQKAGSTMYANQIGVSKAHAERSAKLLKQVKHGRPISQNDIIFAKKILVHYRRQITEMGLLD